MTYSRWRLSKLVLQIRKVRICLVAAVAVAEDQNRLMRHRYAVFHDVPRDEPYNVVHLVVSETRVFVIETKSRSVLVLPGWRMMRTTPTRVSDFNADEARGHLQQQHDERLTKKQAERICHRLDPRCRIVEWKVEEAPKKAF